MTGDDNGTVYFDFADELKANTPYIIALPGSDFGNYQLTGKPVTFTGSNAQIKATATGTLSGNSYKFCGSTVGQSHSDTYMLNTTGTSFIKGTATLPAGRLCSTEGSSAVDISVSSATLPQVSGFLPMTATISTSSIFLSAPKWFWAM